MAAFFCIGFVKKDLIPFFFGLSNPHNPNMEALKGNILLAVPVEDTDPASRASWSTAPFAAHQHQLEDLELIICKFHLNPSKSNL